MPYGLLLNVSGLTHGLDTGTISSFVSINEVQGSNLKTCVPMQLIRPSSRKVAAYLFYVVGCVLSDHQNSYSCSGIPTA